MANVKYLNGIKNMLNNVIDVSSDDIKVMLVTSAYTPDGDTHEFKSSVTNEVVGTGYTARGESLANVTWAVDIVNDKVVFNADDVAWLVSTLTARGAVIYKDTAVDATSPLMFYIDFGSDKSSLATDFTIAWDALGVFDVA